MSLAKRVLCKHLQLLLRTPETHTLAFKVKNIQKKKPDPRNLMSDSSSLIYTQKLLIGDIIVFLYKRTPMDKGKN